MKNSKLYTLLIILLLSALVLVACGGGGEEAAPEPEAPAEEAAPAEEEAAPEPTEEPMEEPTEEPMEEPTEEPMEEPTEEPAEEEAAEEAPAEAMATLRVWADDTRAPVLTELAPDFLAETGVELVVEQVADMREQFGIAAPAGEGPDILIGAHDWIGSLIASGLLAPIELGAKADQFQPEAIAAFTYNDGNLYGMPYATESLAFCRNTDLVPEAPATWDEVKEVGGNLVGNGDTANAFVLTGTTYDAYPSNTAFGGYIFGRDADGNYDATDVGLDSEGFIASGEWIDGMIKDGLMPQSTDWDTAHVLFETGDVPFLMAGPWAIDRLNESGVSYECGPFPDDGAPFLGVQGFMVNALSENKLLAETFLTEFVATEDTMQALADAGNRPSAFTPTFEAIDEDTVIYDFAQVSQNAQPMPAIPEMAAVWDAWNNGITLIINQELTPEEALTDAAQQVRDIISEGS